MTHGKKYIRFGEVVTDNKNMLKKIFVLMGMLCCSGIWAQGIEMEKIVVGEDEKIEAGFCVSDITSDLFARMKGKSYKDDCTLDVKELRYLKVLYWDFNDEECSGEIVCNVKIADDLIYIFRELYKAHYQIEKIRLVDEYDADDESSMADNNSSCFNFRFISFTTTVSKHGAGMAIDINPLYNPYIKTVNGRTNIEPANSTPYVYRDKDFPHKITHDDLCYKLFAERGFEWGGDWSPVKDYQHFEK